MENGLPETEPPHGSTVGSNGYILSKQQEDTVSALHRTNWPPIGGSTLGHGTKSSPPSASMLRSPDQGSSNGAASLGLSPTERRAETETKNGRVSNTPPPTIHRARKTMSRPASNQTLKVMRIYLHEISPTSAALVMTGVHSALNIQQFYFGSAHESWSWIYIITFLFLIQLLNRENKEPVVVKDDGVGKPEAVQPQPSPIQNQLPQSQTDATSVLNTTPAKPQTGYTLYYLSLQQHWLL